MESEVIPTEDGRLARTTRTREGILSATRDLILDGTTDPTAREVADRARITTRTLFRHFPDMESLHLSLIEDAETGAARVMDEPFNLAEGTWQEHLQTVIDRRVRVYESLLPLYVSIIWQRYRAEASNRQVIQRRRKRLREILPERLAGDPALFEALDGVLGIEYWTSLRRDQRLSTGKATKVLQTAVQKLTRE